MRAGPDTPLVVIALGGNALLRRGEPLDAPALQGAARAAAAQVAAVAGQARLVLTHGNGPQVGLLALAQEAPAFAHAAQPLDVLGAETEGQLGYLLELELRNALPGREVVALITTTEVDAGDPAFGDPVKPIGPVYTESDAQRMAAARGWTVHPDTGGWRRVVPSPAPRHIGELAAIRRLVGDGVLVVCAGGGGIPVVRGADGRLAGVEAVVDKDPASALLAGALGADVLVLATDVDGVHAGWGTPGERLLTAATPLELRALALPAGSMGPKVAAAVAFVEAGGTRAAIGALDQLPALVAGRAGTQITRARGR